jgi:hypothetical protein
VRGVYARSDETDIKHLRWNGANRTGVNVANTAAEI